MERRIWIYLLSAAVAAGFAVAAVFGFLYALLPVGIICSLMAFLSLLMLFAAFRQDNLTFRCDELFQKREFDEVKGILDRASKSLLFPFYRITVYLFYIFTEAALDHLELSERYISRLRHGSGEGWKYRTAYIYILILLDKEDFKTARAEFEEFRKNNENSDIYKSQIEVLDALFARLFTRNDSPLPEAAVNSFFPVVQRILGKHFEKQAQDGTEWD